MRFSETGEENEGRVRVSSSVGGVKVKVVVSVRSG